MTIAVSRGLRVLLLTDEGLVPERPRSGRDGREAELCKTEYDVLEALERVGHEVFLAGVGSELSVIREAIDRYKPHVAFNLVEQFDGLADLDQHVVSYLELKRQKYTGCNPRGLTLARDKALTKKILAYHRIYVPRFSVHPVGRKPASGSRLQFPAIVKPLAEEGSEGISQASIVSDPDTLARRVAFVHEKTGGSAIVEEFIEGREIYVSILGNEHLTALPAWELTMCNLPKDAAMIATDKAKWDPDYQKRVGLRSAAADLDARTIRDIEKLSKRIYRLLNLSGYARLDYRLHETGRLYLLEANPNPQIAQDEDFARSAGHAGMAYEELLHKIITLGMSYTARH